MRMSESFCSLTSPLVEAPGLRLQGKDFGQEFLVFVGPMAIVSARTSTSRDSYKGILRSDRSKGVVQIEGDHL